MKKIYIGLALFVLMLSQPSYSFFNSHSSWIKLQEKAKVKCKEPVLDYLSDNYSLVKHINILTKQELANPQVAEFLKVALKDDRTGVYYNFFTYTGDQSELNRYTWTRLGISFLLIDKDGEIHFSEVSEIGFPSRENIFSSLKCNLDLNVGNHYINNDYNHISPPNHIKRKVQNQRMVVINKLEKEYKIQYNKMVQSARRSEKALFGFKYILRSYKGKTELKNTILARVDREISGKRSRREYKNEINAYFDEATRFENKEINTFLVKAIFKKASPKSNIKKFDKYGRLLLFRLPPSNKTFIIMDRFNKYEFLMKNGYK